MPCWLLFLAASCQQLTHSTGGGDEHLHLQGGSAALREPSEQIGLTRNLSSFYPRQLWPSLCPQACKKARATASAELQWESTFGGISLTPRRQRLWTTSWKPLWTGLKSAWLEQKLCREKPRTRELMSDCDCSLLPCAPLAAQPRGWQAVPPAMLPPEGLPGRALVSNTTDCWWLRPAAVQLGQNQIITLTGLS